MPSVRIKRADYAQLGDQSTETPTFPRSSIVPSAPGGDSLNVPQTQSQSPGRSRRATVASLQDVPRLSPVVGRPRAGSRVADHVMSRTSAMGLREQRSGSSIGGHGGSSRRSSTARRSPAPAGMILMEGQQAEVHRNSLYPYVFTFLMPYLTGYDTI